AADDAAHHVLAEHLGGGGHVGMRQEMVGARDPTARVGAHRRAPLVVPTSAVLGTGTSSGADGRGPSRPGGSGAAGTVLAGKIPAEADGNRTRQTEMLGLTGFEDRGAHQDTYASAAQTITAGPARIWICWAALPDGADTLVRRRPAAAPEGGAVIGSGHERLPDPSCGPALDPPDHHGARRGLRLEDPAGRARGGGRRALRPAVPAGDRGPGGRGRRRRGADRRGRGHRGALDRGLLHAGGG